MSHGCGRLRGRGQYHYGNDYSYSAPQAQQLVLIATVLVMLQINPSPRTNTASPSSHFASSSYSIVSTPRLLDTGATHHITTNFDNLSHHSEYHCPEELLISNDNHIPILHTGSSFISNNTHSFV